jgi:Ca-activated chloride channel homolog
VIDQERAIVRLVAFLICAAGLWESDVSRAVGQSNVGVPPAPPVNIHVDTTLVLIPVTVTDSLNRFAIGLEKQDFRLFEDGTEQKVTHFSGEDTPLSVGIVFDASGSMDDKLEISRQAVGQFLKTMNSEDESFLIEFNDRVQLSVPFTNRTAEIQNRLTAVRAQGLTALLDAMHLALQEMKKAKNPRKALLVISDGGDNKSHYTSKQITDLVREADVQIYSMGIFEPILYIGMTPEEVSGSRLLSEISEQTGGRAFAAVNSKQLPSIAGRIGIELRNQYVLAYAPANQEKDGKYRKVEVKMKQPEGAPPLKARWRLGYYAPNQ